MGNALTDWLASRFDEVTPLEFYRDLFPPDSLDVRGALTKGKYAGVVTRIARKESAGQTVFYDDLSPIEKIIGTDDFIVIPPISFAGKNTGQRYARHLYAIAFDVDEVVINDDGKPVGLIDLVHQMTKENPYLPLATYIVSSGNGVHVYYFLKDPLRLYSPTVEQLRKYRTFLTKKLWNAFVSNSSDNPQYESVTQGFRAVGSISKDKKQRVRAFKVGGRVTMQYMNDFVPDEYKFKVSSGRIGLDEAKKKYPQWYERRIVQGQQKGTWTTKPDLYYWWIRKIYEGATVGHRYFCVMALAVYARKAGIPRKQLERDALSLIDFLDSLTDNPQNHFDESDVWKALEAYKARYITFPRATIEQLTGIEIPPNKRNKRKQAEHMKFLHGMNAVRRSLGEDLGAGRPSKESLVREYLEQHPEAPILEISSSLMISRQCASKWKKRIEREEQ